MKELNSIPLPDYGLVNSMHMQFLPDHDMTQWIHETFINDKSKLYNPEHNHLAHADIGFLWTNVMSKSKGRWVLGTAEKPRTGSSKWSALRGIYQLEQWFGKVPDFIITVDANYFYDTGNPERCALLEHELYHCAQKKDKYGVPAFSQQTGKPLFEIRGHDVEEFIGVVRRYGAKAAGVEDLVNAANQEPLIARAAIDGICGTCMKNVA